MNSFSETVKHILKYYIYALVDPRNNEVFYIGKGCNDRVFQHEKEEDPDRSPKKLQRIDSIKKSNLSATKLIILYGLSEQEAFAAEAALINFINFIEPNKLTNIVSGNHAKPVITTEEAELFLGAKPLTSDEIKHNLLIIKINSLYKHDMTDKEIMDSARGHWVINTDNAYKAEFLLAVYKGIVVGVYENMRWYSSGEQTSFYPRLSEENLSLKNRKYCTCSPVLNSEYNNRNIGDIVKDSQNPVSYIWKKDCQPIQQHI